MTITVTPVMSEAHRRAAPAYRAALDPAVYAAAADLLEQRELAKDLLWGGEKSGSWFDDKWNLCATLAQVRREADCLCAMGALVLAADQLGYAVGQFSWTCMVAPAKDMMETPRSPNWWNNQPQTTKQDVLAALRVAAAKSGPPEWLL